MDFPLFHLDWLNNRFLIAVIALLHVFINHGIAVGFIPLVAWFEQKGIRRGGAGRAFDAEWDDLVYRMMKVGFIITTTIGALTGVGIWFSAALISPASIGSLIRVFYFAWFLEWLVFVTEVVLILIYFLSWKKANAFLSSKLRHNRFGWYLALFSWITMAIIVAILGFMMDPGNWNEQSNLINGFFNPLYLPQLSFRTPAAMVMGGMFAMVLVTLFSKRGTELRIVAVKACGLWVLAWLPLAAGAAVWYYGVIPSGMVANMSTAVGTMDFEAFYQVLSYVILSSVPVILVTAAVAYWRPKAINLALIVVPCLMAFGFLGIFERVREFVRKPYIIGEYMYSNLIRQEDYPLLQRDGVLKHAVYSSTATVTSANMVEAGKNVFMLTCSRCHTSAAGINSITQVFDRMYGKSGKPFDPDAMKAYIPGMHNARTYMPPFPGNEREIEALVAYILHLQQTGETLEGAQSAGVVLNRGHDSQAASELLVKAAHENELNPNKALSRQP